MTIADFVCNVFKFTIKPVLNWGWTLITASAKIKKLDARIKELEKRITELEKEIVIIPKLKEQVAEMQQYTYHVPTCPKCYSKNMYFDPIEYRRVDGKEEVVYACKYGFYRYWICKDCGSKVHQNKNSQTMTYSKHYF